MITDWLNQHPWGWTTLWLIGLLLTAIIVYNVLRVVLFRTSRPVIAVLIRSGRDEAQNILTHLSRIAPAFIIWLGINAVPGLPQPIVAVIANVANAFIIFTSALALSSALDLFNILYQYHPRAKMHPIKGLIQIAKIVLFAVVAIFILATLIDKSPLILLSGIGAMAAVLILVFQDTLLSFVAGIQISSTDMVRMGDWIEIPQLGANGDVIEIALHTVKVQNFDKTITTVPIRKLVTDPFKNWRGMREAGGRRIKRSIFIDLNSIAFLDDKQIETLSGYSLISDYMSGKQEEIKDWNHKLEHNAQIAANTRRLTNIGTFRAYCQAYIMARPDIRKDLTLLVRHMDAGADGIPLEVYCFTNTIVWAQYETIQADIFDHLYSILPYFGLKVFQAPTGTDMRQIMQPKP